MIYKDHNRGSFFEECCAKRWRKEHKKTGISADDWWEQNKGRDFDKEFRGKILVAIFIICLVVVAMTIINYHRR